MKRFVGIVLVLVVVIIASSATAAYGKREEKLLAGMTSMNRPELTYPDELGATPYYPEPTEYPGKGMYWDSEWGTYVAEGCYIDEYGKVVPATPEPTPEEEVAAEPTLGYLSQWWFNHGESVNPLDVAIRNAVNAPPADTDPDDRLSSLNVHDYANQVAEMRKVGYDQLAYTWDAFLTEPGMRSFKALALEHLLGLDLSQYNLMDKTTFLGWLDEVNQLREGIRKRDEKALRAGGFLAVPVYLEEYRGGEQTAEKELLRLMKLANEHNRWEHAKDTTDIEAWAKANAVPISALRAVLWSVTEWVPFPPLD